MAEMHFSFSSELPFSADKVYAWHLRKGALERMLPPWKNITFLFPPGSPADAGSQVGLKVHLGPASFRWILEHKNLTHFAFSDVQVRGPFKYYSHHHHVIFKGDSSCLLSEEIRCDPYVPFLESYLRREFSRMFSWRHARLKEDLALFERHPSPPLRILLSGSRGLIGSHLKILLQTAGHRVVCLSRGSKESSEDTVYWDPTRGHLQRDDFEDFDAVVHLAGGSIAGGRWTKKEKNQIFLSRCRDTWLLSQVLCRLYRPPQTVISASAVGFYGDRGDEALDEGSGKGKGFLADVCQKWEQATEAIENRGSRVVHPRFGMVLSRKGGALKKMLLGFKCGLGGRLGSGDQLISWIGIDDAVGALYHMLMQESLAGPINVVSPQAISQKEFARSLAKHIHRPACFPLPAGILKLILREMAEEVLLSSARAVPKQLLSSGYTFRHPDLESVWDSVI
jgi:uncharacterized protein